MSHLFLPENHASSAVWQPSQSAMAGANNLKLGFLVRPPIKPDEGLRLQDCRAERDSSGRRAQKVSAAALPRGRYVIAVDTSFVNAKGVEAVCW